MNAVATTDLLGTLLTPSPAVQALRQARSKVTLATQGSYDSLFAPDLPGGLSLDLRLLVALYAAVLTPQAELAAHYRERLQAQGVAPGWLAAVQHDALSGLDDPRLHAVLGYTRTLIVAPREGDRDALQGLLAAGLSAVDVVSLAQLIAFVAYQVRLVVGLSALESEA